MSKFIHHHPHRHGEDAAAIFSSHEVISPNDDCHILYASMTRFHQFSVKSTPYEKNHKMPEKVENTLSPFMAIRE